MGFNESVRGDEKTSSDSPRRNLVIHKSLPKPPVYRVSRTLPGRTVPPYHHTNVAVFSSGSTDTQVTVGVWSPTGVGVAPCKDPVEVLDTVQTVQSTGRWDLNLPDSGVDLHVFATHHTCLRTVRTPPP